MTTTLLPAFPLDIVVLPGEDQYLHIFEQRYLQLISELKDSGAEFAIPYTEKDKVHPYGVLVKIDSVFGESPEGTLYISVSGTGTFKLKNLLDKYPGKLYPAAEIEAFPIETTAEDKLVMAELHPKLIELLSLFKGENSKLAVPVPENTFAAAALLRFQVEKKLELISIPEEKNRLRWLANEIVLQIRICETEYDLQGQFSLN